MYRRIRVASHAIAGAMLWSRVQVTRPAPGPAPRPADRRARGAGV